MKKMIVFVAVAGVSMVFLFPETLMAVQTTTDNFSGKEIENHADTVSNFLFGPVAKICAVLGGGYGFVSSLLTGSPKPLITFGGIGLSVAIIPQFIKSVFTILLP